MNIKLSGPTLDYLCDLITGDSKISFYRSGFQIVNFFNDLGENDIYDNNFKGRKFYTELKLREINNTPKMCECIISFFDSRNFLNNENLLNSLINKFNEILEYDKYQVVNTNKIIKVITKDSYSLSNVIKIDNDFINQEIAKCEDKIVLNDYEGAISSSKSLVETILLYIYHQTYKKEPDYQNNIFKLYQLIQKSLNLKPEDTNDELIKQILNGLTSIISGLSSLKNKSNIKYKPHLHHALLAVNSAKVFSDFIIRSYWYQRKK